jgi:hypothetical protein
VVHHLLPGAGAEFRICAINVDAGQGEVEMRLTLCVVVRLEEPLGFVLIVGLEAGLFASGFVLKVIDAPGAFD